MDFFDVLDKRKSIRKYIPNSIVPKKDVDKILEAINLAPSAKHLQSYRVYIAQSTITINKIFAACYNQRSDFIGNAALILVFCTDPKDAIACFGQRGKVYSLQDATIAAVFGMLSAVSLGYATCWVGNFRGLEMKKALKTALAPVALLVIGKSDEDPVRPLRKSLDIISKKI